MFNTFHPNVNATIAFLKLLSIKVNPSTVNDTLLNHPEWPSLLSISDSLNKWHVPNAAAKIGDATLDQIQLPCIICLRDQENPMAVVTNINDSTIDIYHEDYKRLRTESRNEFLKKWNGIYLLAKPDEHSGEANYQQNKNKVFRRSLLSISALTGVITLIVLFFFRAIGAINVEDNASIIGLCLQMFILFSGTVVTTLLLWYEIDKNNALLQKVCTGISKGNCNAILTSELSRPFKWLSWSEVGFFYFVGGMLALLSSGSNLTNTLSIVSWLSMFALPYTVFSIYYQWKVAKQWCVLCIAVQILLIAGGINVIANNLLSSSLSITPVLSTVAFYFLVAIMWFAIKPYILKLQESNTIKREYLRIKFNSEIFETLLKNQKLVTDPANNLGIELGNKNASFELIKVCNPYCGPCSKAHPEIEKLLEENENIKVRIIFTATNSESDKKNKPVKHLLAIAGKNDSELTKKALDDWYLAKVKDYDAFAAKYPMNGELKEQSHKIEAMDNWCKAMEITATPTLFVKGHKLPEAYSIGDLAYFLLE